MKVLIKEGVDLVKKIKVRFNEAQFNARKFRSNSKELRTYFAFENTNIVSNTVHEAIVDSKINIERKILGILWDEIEDNLVFQLDDIATKNATNVISTKGNILSVMSTVYDLLGYLQPLKVLFQNICKLNIDWDSTIGELIVEWKKICENLKRSEEMVFKRCYFIYDSIKEISSKEAWWVSKRFAISLCSMQLFTISNAVKKCYS